MTMAALSDDFQRMASDFQNGYIMTRRLGVSPYMSRKTSDQNSLQKKPKKMNVFKKNISFVC